MATRQKPGTKTTRTDLRPMRKEMILEAATELFRKYGYGGVGVEEIAAAAGITPSGLYRHYKNKQAILASVLEHGATDLLAETERVISAAATPLEAFTAATELSISRVVDQRLLVSAYYQARHLPEPMHRRFRSHQRRLIAMYVDVTMGVRPDLTRAEARLAVLGTASLIEACGHADEKIDRARLRELLRQLVFGAVLNGDPAQA